MSHGANTGAINGRDAPCLSLVEGDRLAARVDDDEVVAEAMHLEERQRGHDGRLYGLLVGPSLRDSARMLRQHMPSTAL